jgi:hypothetical protein
MLTIMMVQTLDYMLFMILKVMDFVLVLKKDSLIAQETTSMIITVVIVKMLEFTVTIHLNQNQNFIMLN